MSANDKQVAGDHYRTKIQHWDFAADNDLDYFQGQITKYVTRWKKKNGLVDLEKGLHFLEKYIELEKAKIERIRLEQEDEKFKTSLTSDTSYGNPYRNITDVFG